MPVELMKSGAAPLGREIQAFCWGNEINSLWLLWNAVSEKGINPKTWGFVLFFLLSVQTAGWNPNSPSPLLTFLAWAWEIFHSTDFTIEGSTAVKNHCEEQCVCGTKCCLFLIFPPEFLCQDNTLCSFAYLYSLSFQHFLPGIRCSSESVQIWSFLSQTEECSPTFGVSEREEMLEALRDLMLPDSWLEIRWCHRGKQLFPHQALYWHIQEQSTHFPWQKKEKMTNKEAGNSFLSSLCFMHPSAARLGVVELILKCHF